MTSHENENDDDMIDPYLWDRSGPVDLEVERLETLLAPLAHAEPLVKPVTKAPAKGRRPALAIAAVSICAIAAGLVLGIPRSATPIVADAPEPAPRCGVPVPGGWAFHTEGGPVRCGNSEAASGWMVKDQLLETGEGSRATLEVTALGTVTLEPETKLRLIGSEGDAQKLDLIHGTLHARISASPRLFIVKTGATEVFDLGCEYTVSADERGNGRVEVLSGAVSLERPAQSPTLVTQGYGCALGAKGPGTPLSDGASERLRRAAEALDRGDDGAFDRVVDAATKSDTLTLWHVMRRRSPAERGRAYDKLATYVQAPKSAPRTAVVAGDVQAFAAYRLALTPVWFDAKVLDAP